MRRRVFLSGAAGAAMVGGAAVLGGLRLARAAPPTLLSRAGVALGARFTRYAAAKATDVDDVPLSPAGTARHVLGEATWSCAARVTPAKDARGKARPDAVDVVATFKLERGAATGAGVALVLSFDGWWPGNYVLLPGACYAGNRFESRRLPYPPLLAEAADIGPNVPMIVSDIPRLNVHAGPSRLEVLAADLATPAVGVHVAARGLGVIALVDPATRVGLSGLAVEETDDRGRARIVLAAPGVCEEAAWSPPGARRASKDRGATFRQGETLTLRTRVFIFASADAQGLFDKLAHVRKDLTGPTARPHEVPFSAAFKLHEARVSKRWIDEPGYFASSLREGVPQLQNGWCGGLAATLPLLALGDAESRARARRNLAFVLTNGQAPSGFFHSMRDGKAWLEDGAAVRGSAAEGARPAATRKFVRRWHLVRRTSDTLAFALKQLALLQRQDPTFKPESRWVRAITRASDALVRLWDHGKQLGQFVDVETGDIVVGGSTSAGITPAALALAGTFLKRDDCLAVALAAAEQMFERYVRVGITCGGPGDALQCPDSESAAALLESFMTLYELTNERLWIDRAAVVAAQLSSWVISYDHPAGAGETSGARATGAVLSNAQSARGAPGFTLSSGDALLRLYRATGDLRHLELLRDTVHNLAQYLPRAEEAERPTREARPPRRARADTTDWLDPSDDVVPAGSLFDAACMLSYSEVPGVYVRTTSKQVFAFDHVDARLEAAKGGPLRLQLANPTESEAVVRVLAETDAEAARPLAPGAVLAARTVTVPAHGSAELELPVEEPVAAP
jgi:hypothetical protein